MPPAPLAGTTGCEERMTAMREGCLCWRQSFVPCHLCSGRLNGDESLCTQHGRGKRNIRLLRALWQARGSGCAAGGVQGCRQQGPPPASGDRELPPWEHGAGGCRGGPPAHRHTARPARPQARAGRPLGAHHLSRGACPSPPTRRSGVTTRPVSDPAAGVCPRRAPPILPAAVTAQPEDKAAGSLWGGVAEAVSDLPRRFPVHVIGMMWFPVCSTSGAGAGHWLLRQTPGKRKPEPLCPRPQSVPGPGVPGLCWGGGGARGRGPSPPQEPWLLPGGGEATPGRWRAVPLHSNTWTLSPNPRPRSVSQLPLGRRHVGLCWRSPRPPTDGGADGVVSI